jgi:2-polyprenyl-3-methyl-5-hydroxy-6-metoxy-1,4-benzoquinol methylase
MSNVSYRDRLYQSYVRGRETPLAPASLNALAPKLRQLRKIVRYTFPENKSARILDIGCGHGALLHLLRRLAYHDVRGIDVSPEQVAAAKRLGIDGVEQGDFIPALQQCADDSHDVIVALDVIEHMTKPELLLLADEIHRVLKPGGRWVVHVPNAESPFFGRVRYGDMTHELAFTRVSLDQLLRTCGFSSVVCFEETPAVHSLNSALRMALWTALRTLLLLYLVTEAPQAATGAILSQNFIAFGEKG